MHGLYKRKVKKPSSSPANPTNMLGSLEDETQQPLPQTRPLARYATEPTLKNEPSQSYNIPPAHRTYPHIEDTYQSQVNSTGLRNDLPESEESDKLNWGTFHKPSSPVRPLPGLQEDLTEDDQGAGKNAMTKEDPLAPNGASPTKRLSPIWRTVSPRTVDTDVSEKDPEVEDDEDELEETQIVERDSFPPDDVNVPTPSDSPDERTPPPAPLAAATRSPVEQSPLRPLTEHPPPIFARSLNDTPRKHNLISPTHRLPSNLSPSMANRSKAKSTTPLASRSLKRARSPSLESLDDDMTAGMMPNVRPRERLHSLFNPAPPPADLVEECDDGSVESSGEGPSALSSFNSKGNDRHQVEQTYVDPQAATSPTVPPRENSAQPSSPNFPKGSDTLIDGPRSDQAPLTSPADNGRFPRQASPSPAPTIILSDDNGYLGDNFQPDDDDAHSFQATQVHPDLPQEDSMSPARPRSLLFSSASRQGSLRRTPTTLATAIVSSIPEHRRLQPRAQTSVSEGQRSALLRQFQQRLPAPLRSPSPDLEPTFIENPQATAQPGSSTSSHADTNKHDALATGSAAPPPALEPAQPSHSPVSTERNSSGEKMPSEERHSDIHEPWGESLAQPSPTRRSPNKYGKKWNKRKSNTASDDFPEHVDDEDAGSDSGESTPEDPEDFTYKDPPQPQLEGYSSSMDPIGETPQSPSLPPRAPAPKQPVKIKLRVQAKTTTRPTAASSSSRGTRGKRKAMSPSPELSGSSSGSAPEDNEDFTYVDKGKGKGKGKGKAQVSAPPTRPAKRAKSGPATSRPASNSAPPRRSSRSVSIRAPSAAPVEDLLPTSSAVTPPVTIPDGPIRVLALWKKTSEYFAGTVDARLKTGFRIKFDDNTTATVPIDKMRLLDLKAGEPIRAARKGSKAREEFRVNAAFSGNGDKIRVLDNESEPLTILVRDLVVLPEVIEQRFGKRVLDPAVLEARFPLPAGRGQISSTGTTRPLHGKVFLISRGPWRGDIDTLQKRIENNGGKVENDWKAIFNIRDDGYELKSKLAPFVLQVATPASSTWSYTTMAALASGIPILASRYIDDAIDGEADWRNYVVAAGESRYLFSSDPVARPVSQVIDPNWGDSSWNSTTARPVRQAFKDLNVLFLEPTAKKYHDLKALVPLCFMALGATVCRTKSLPKSLADYDLVMIEDRDKNPSFTGEHRKSGKAVNTAWLKACLPIGKCLRPSIVRTGE